MVSIVNRREFIKLSTAAITAAVVPGVAVAAFKDGVVPEFRNVPGFIETGRQMGKTTMANKWLEFEAQHRYGNGLSITYKPTKYLRDQLVEILYRDMVKTVPPEYREQVSIYGPITTDYGRAATISWMYEPEYQGVKQKLAIGKYVSGNGKTGA